MSPRKVQEEGRIENQTENDPRREKALLRGRPAHDRTESREYRDPAGFCKKWRVGGVQFGVHGPPGIFQLLRPHTIGPAAEFAKYERTCAGKFALRLAPDQPLNIPRKLPRNQRDKL